MCGDRLFLRVILKPFDFCWIRWRLLPRQRAVKSIFSQQRTKWIISSSLLREMQAPEIYYHSTTLWHGVLQLMLAQLTLLRLTLSQLTLLQLILLPYNSVSSFICYSSQIVQQSDFTTRDAIWCILILNTLIGKREK